MSFADFFPETAGNIDINRFSPESLAFLDYKQELELKNNALKALLAEGRIKAPLLPVVPSPLPRNYRISIYLYYYEGYSAREIGIILGKSESTVNQYLSRGRRKLKGLLTEERRWVP